MEVSFSRGETLKEGSVGVEDSRLYLFSFFFLFLFYFSIYFSYF